jgi:leucyl/phenylalanyl-tRNA--protein transferase
VEFPLLPWLSERSPFPPVEFALRVPNGLLAAGADLSPDRLIEAYSLGIFPWFSDGEPILWWSPDPRMVLFPEELRVTRSLAKVLRNRDYEVRADTAFTAVMQACAAPRDDQAGTWISRRMVHAYSRLHELGVAHCVETWIDGALAGGLYGVQLGGAFYGESMFTRVRDASKIALVHLVHHLRCLGVRMIDCQMATPHLASLGAREIPRREFCAQLPELVKFRLPAQSWRLTRLDSYQIAALAGRRP